MASYLTIQFNCPNQTVADLNAVLQGGDSTKAHEALNTVDNLINAIQLGTIAATVTATSSTVAGTVSGQTGGVTVTLNLT